MNELRMLPIVIFIHIPLPPHHIPLPISLPCRLQFEPGNEYFFMTTTTSSREGIRNRNGLRCSDRRMRLRIRVCCTAKPGALPADGSESNRLPSDHGPDHSQSDNPSSAASQFGGGTGTDNNNNNNHILPFHHNLANAFTTAKSTPLPEFGIEQGVETDKRYTDKHLIPVVQAYITETDQKQDARSNAAPASIAAVALKYGRRRGRRRGGETETPAKSEPFSDHLPETFLTRRYRPPAPFSILSTLARFFPAPPSTLASCLSFLLLIGPSLALSAALTLNADLPSINAAVATATAATAVAALSVVAALAFRSLVATELTLTTALGLTLITGVITLWARPVGSRGDSSGGEGGGRERGGGACGIQTQRSLLSRVRQFFLGENPGYSDFSEKTS